MWHLVYSNKAHEYEYSHYDLVIKDFVECLGWPPKTSNVIIHMCHASPIKTIGS